VGAVRSVATVAEVVAELEAGYIACLRDEQAATAALMNRYAGCPA
jgi:nitronate monooxygenase